MNDINEVRERLEQAAEIAATYGEGDDLRALLAGLLGRCKACGKQVRIAPKGRGNG